MGSFYLILGLVVSLIIAIVALANTESVTVSYIFGRTEVSLILLILGSAFIGALVMGLFSLFRSIRSAFAFRDLRQKQEALQKQVKVLEEEKIFLEAELNKALSVPEDAEEVKAEKQEEDLQPAEPVSSDEEAEEEPS